MKTNPKPFWQYLKGCGSDPVGINEIIYNGRTLSDVAEKATCLNRYFQSVFLSQSACSSQSSNSNVPLMQPIELSVSGIESLLKNLDESKAISPDGIAPRILKLCAHAISLCLYLIFHKSLTTGQMPQDWKIANVVPIHKGGSEKEVTKMMEHII